MSELSLVQAKRWLSTSTVRLTLTYLALIMLMSISFSVVFYNIVAGQLERQFPPSYFADNFIDRYGNPIISRQAFEDFLRHRIDEGRHVLIIRLVGLNLLIMAGGAVLSYYLARRTLQPIEAAFDAQSQFVSDASHELRTPLTAIRTSNEVALRKPKLTLAEAKDLIQQNTADATRLQSLTDGLLHLATNRRPQVAQPVALQEVVAEAMNHIVTLAQTKDITVQDNVPNLQVLADPASLGQCITILLDNAIKYSPAGSRITLDVAAKGKTVNLNVRDQGMGVRAADLPHIFKRFYRADRSRTKEHTDGYGLGLSIADKLMRQQGGQITAKSTVGKGSTFTIKLPAA